MLEEIKETENQIEKEKNVKKLDEISDSQTQKTKEENEKKGNKEIGNKNLESPKNLDESNLKKR